MGYVLFFLFQPQGIWSSFGWKKTKTPGYFGRTEIIGTDILLGEGTLKDSMVVERGNERRMKMVLWFICCSCYTFDLHNNYLRLKLTFTPPTSMILESKQPLGDMYILLNRWRFSNLAIFVFRKHGVFVGIFGDLFLSRFGLCLSWSTWAMEVGEGRPYKTADFFFSGPVWFKKVLNQVLVSNTLLLPPLFGEMIQMD